MQEYELQKMETTRIELEKLTASAEFKKFQNEKKREARRGAVNASMVVVGRDEDDMQANGNRSSFR